jgi:nucleoside-diphosphate-sugar epimerase
MNIFITGGCGYKGHVLIPKLLKLGHFVTAHDIQWFGNFHEEHSNLKIIRGDIRHLDKNLLKNVDCIIHLASIANDPCGDLDPKLTWETSALSTMQLADMAARAGVKRFLYASSGSVYGISEELEVKEDLELKPVSEYNKTKMVSERVLLSYSNDFVVQIIRPATVCGISRRMRLDVAVNLLTMQALTKKEITVLGGGQVRPNIHIDDITDVYLHLLSNPRLTGIYNAGFENISIIDIAKLIVARIPAKINIVSSNDPRSYRINSDKLLATGFKPKKNVINAIDEIKLSYDKGDLKDSSHFYNLNWMLSQNLINNLNKNEI